MNNNKGLMELIFGLFDRLTVAKDGRSRFFNFLTMLMIFFIVFTVYQWDEIKTLYKETRYEVFVEAIAFERSQSFIQSAQQQLQILYVNSGADLTVVYEYYPPDKHYFYSAVFFEGMLPEGKDIEVLKSIPIDKTSSEYITHLNGLPYSSFDTFKFFPHELGNSFAYVYSCPIFNLGNIYSGSVSMVWYESPDITEQKLKDLHAMCFQSARVLGRAK